MKKAYIIRMSEDGNAPYVYTNIKALYNGIIATGYDVKYFCHIDDNHKWININFTYANLIKELKKYAGFHLYKETEADGYGSLEIQEISIISK